MNYLEIELSLRTWTILGGLSTIAIIIIVVVLLAKRFNRKLTK